MQIYCKRIYDAPSPEDGCRILVDRLWPRGVSKERAELDYWMRDIAPSTELRKWYAHDPEHYEEFRARYWLELEVSDKSVRKISYYRLFKILVKKGVVVIKRDRTYAAIRNIWNKEPDVISEKGFVRDVGKNGLLWHSPRKLTGYMLNRKA